MKYGLRRPRVRRLVYCQLLPDDRAPHSTVRASPWRNSEGRESAGSTTDPIASAWRWRHLEAFTQQRALNRRRRLCGCGAQPDPGYRTCAWCRVWASWAKRRQRNPVLRLDYRTTQFVAGCADHGNAARAAREAKLGTGLGARRVGYCLLQKPHVRAAIADLKAAILNRAHQRSRARPPGAPRTDRAARPRGSAARAKDPHADASRSHGRRKAPRRLARRRTIAARSCLPPVPGRACTP